MARFTMLGGLAKNSACRKKEGCWHTTQISTAMEQVPHTQSTMVVVCQSTMIHFYTPHLIARQLANSKTTSAKLPRISIGGAIKKDNRTTNKIVCMRYGYLSKACQACSSARARVTPQ